MNTTSMKLAPCIWAIACLIPGHLVGQSLAERLAGTESVYLEPIRGRNLIQISLGTLGDPELTMEYPSRDQVKPGERYKNIREIMVVGEIPPSDQQWANKLLKDRLSEYLGAEKLALWPQDQFRNRYGDPDQKNIDSDFYIIVYCRDFRIDRMINETEGSTTFSFMGTLGPIRISLYEKTKAGKKGKKIITAKGSPLDTEELEDVKIDQLGMELFPELEQSAEIIKREFKVVFTRLVDDFFEQIASGK